MSLRKQQSEFAKNIGLLINFACANGFELTFGEVFRTEFQQKYYFEKGLSKTMNSRHLQRMAVDFNIFKDDKMLFSFKGDYMADILTAKPLGDFWESLHVQNIWGADFNRNGVYDDNFQDPYHFEMKPV